MEASNRASDTPPLEGTETGSRCGIVVHARASAAGAFGILLCVHADGDDAVCGLKAGGGKVRVRDRWDRSIF